MVVYKQQNRSLECLSNLPKFVLLYYSQAVGLNLSLIDAIMCVFFPILPENQKMPKFKSRTSDMQSTCPITEYWDKVREEIIGFVRLELGTLEICYGRYCSMTTQNPFSPPLTNKWQCAQLNNGTCQALLQMCTASEM